MNGSFLVKWVAGLLTMSVGLIGMSSCTAATNELVPPEVGTKQRECDDCPLMIVVPAGSFTMGSPESEHGRWEDEGPQHVVTIPQVFWVGVHEVSFAEWGACVAAGECSHIPNDYGLLHGKHPVINVSWKDVTHQYVEWLKKRTGKPYRLLTESEWEYVARAGTSTARFWGAGLQCDYANGLDESAQGFYGIDDSWDVVTCDDEALAVANVGSYRPNDFGIYDALGNAWEWTQDCWHESYSGAPTDGSAWEESGYCEVAVIRGGGWLSSPLSIRSAMRYWEKVGDRLADVGFRVARSLSADELHRQRASTTSGGSPTSGGRDKDGPDHLPPGSTSTPP